MPLNPNPVNFAKRNLRNYVVKAKTKTFVFLKTKISRRGPFIGFIQSCYWPINILITIIQSYSVRGKKMIEHRSVLLKEVIEYLNPQPNQDFADCTVGEAGHAAEILHRTSPSGKLLAIDWDKYSLERAKAELTKFEDRVSFAGDNFKNLKSIAEKFHFRDFSGIFFDLGLATYQIKNPNYGLSFQIDAPLDMRIVPQAGKSAAEIVNRYSLEKLIDIFRNYGDESFAKPIAKAILQVRRQRKIATTFQLVKIIQAVKKVHKKIHPATQVFQALRIEVNEEFDNLKQGLSAGADLLKVSGRLAVISFHSGEDRIVKQFFKARKDLKIITKKPVRASLQEIKINPQSRSGKLRVAEKQKMEG